MNPGINPFRPDHGPDLSDCQDHGKSEGVVFAAANHSRELDDIQRRDGCAIKNDLGANKAHLRQGPGAAARLLDIAKTQKPGHLAKLMPLLGIHLDDEKPELVDPRRRICHHYDFRLFSGHLSLRLAATSGQGYQVAGRLFKSISRLVSPPWGLPP
ncbi:MAG: hypothetical protein HQL37_12650 [Alphaproteobacteria bacterium]|nr:hypothetical protein [Alphaproteobacteria bacterium]